MDIVCSISVGELLDKISILQIKQEKIADDEKRRHVAHELDRLLQAVEKSGLAGYEGLLDELRAVNSELWDIEDAIRLTEKAREFGDEFIRLARSVYVQNDRRFDVKKRINERFGSDIQEQKSYQKYS